MTDDPRIRPDVLYTRDDLSVVLRVERVSEVWRLLVLGPRAETAVHGFETADALREFADSVEADLVRRGFRLQIVAERRTGVERRFASRSDVDDRRRGR